METSAKIKSWILALVIGGVAGYFLLEHLWEPATGNYPELGIKTVARAYTTKKSGVMAEVEGVVTRILMDDNDGSRQQQFVINLQNGQMILIKHSADHSNRIPLAVKDVVAVKGTYYWSEAGGIIRWTSDEAGSGYEPGWVEHEGARYD